MNHLMTQPERDAYAQTCFALMDPKHRLSMLIRRFVTELDQHERRGERLPRWKQNELRRACVELHALNRETRI